VTYADATVKLKVKNAMKPHPCSLPCQELFDCTKHTLRGYTALEKKLAPQRVTLGFP